MPEVDRRVVVGKFVAPFGVKGWVKVRSFTDPADNLLQYQPWLTTGANGEPDEWHLESARPQGEVYIAKLRGVEDRDRALSLRGKEISVPRAKLPKLQPGEYYRIDLIGFRVINLQGVPLGRLTGFIETGVHDVMVITADSSEHLVPFVPNHYVDTVDLDESLIRVDWDPNF